MADLAESLVALLSAGLVEEVRLEVVLKPKPALPPTDPVPTITMIIGPPLNEE